MAAIIRRLGAIRDFDGRVARAVRYGLGCFFRVLVACGCASSVHAANTEGAFRDCHDVCPEMVKVPAGAFVMGSPVNERDRAANEGPQRTVRIDVPFAVGKHEVTRAQFAAFAGASPARPRSVGCFVYDAEKSTFRWDATVRDWRRPGYPQQEDHPVVCVAWREAKAYVDWLSKKTGHEYRLLSEVEWEYAARAGATTSRPWGDDPNQSCSHANLADDTLVREIAHGPGRKWYAGWHACSDGYAFTAPVGKYRANRFGLHDMLGNAWEWVEDCLNESYSGAPADARPRLSGDCAQRMYRGGAWRSYPAPARSAQRSNAEEGLRHALIGFRVARTLASEQR